MFSTHRFPPVAADAPLVCRADVTSNLRAVSSRPVTDVTLICKLQVWERRPPVVNHSAEYLFRWCGTHFWRPREVDGALMLLAAGVAPARQRTCKEALSNIQFRGEADAAARAVVLRVLSLSGAGELRALQVADPQVVAFVKSVMDRSDAVGVHASHALSSLRAVAWPTWGFVHKPHAQCALIDRHAATITELDCPANFESESARGTLACCTRLEVLKSARDVPPAVWLTLSQLHTLEGVDLGTVSIAAIASALPRLHTLSVFSYDMNLPAAQIDGLFDDLLPRLLEFRFNGHWPAWGAPSRIRESSH